MPLPSYRSKGSGLGQLADCRSASSGAGGTPRSHLHVRGLGRHRHRDLLASKAPRTESAIVFLASGETLWVNAASSPAGRGTGLERRGSEDTAGYDLRLSAKATQLIGASEIVQRRGRRGQATARQFDLSLEPDVGRDSHRERGVTRADTAGDGPGLRLTRRRQRDLPRPRIWVVKLGLPDDDGAVAGSRARAVFQDGSALFAAHGLAAGWAPGGAAAVVVNTHIRQVAAREFIIQGLHRGRAGRSARRQRAGHRSA